MRKRVCVSECVCVHACVSHCARLLHQRVWRGEGCVVRKRVCVRASVCVSMRVFLIVLGCCISAYREVRAVL